MSCLLNQAAEAGLVANLRVTETCRVTGQLAPCPPCSSRSQWRPCDPGTVPAIPAGCSTAFRAWVSQWPCALPALLGASPAGPGSAEVKQPTWGPPCWAWNVSSICIHRTSLILQALYPPLSHKGHALAKSGGSNIPPGWFFFLRWIPEAHLESGGLGGSGSLEAPPGDSHHQPDLGTFDPVNSPSHPGLRHPCQALDSAFPRSVPWLASPQCAAPPTGLPPSSCAPCTAVTCVAGSLAPN